MLQRYLLLLQLFASPSSLKVQIAGCFESLYTCAQVILEFVMEIVKSGFRQDLPYSIHC